MMTSWNFLVNTKQDIFELILYVCAVNSYYNGKVDIYFESHSLKAAKEDLEKYYPLLILYDHEYYEQ